MLCLAHSYYVEKQASELWLPVGWHLLPGFPKPLLVTQEEMHTDMEVKLCQETLKNYNLQQISAALGQSLSVVLLSERASLLEHKRVPISVFFRDSKLKQT